MLEVVARCSEDPAASTSAGLLSTGCPFCPPKQSSRIKDSIIGVLFTREGRKELKDRRTRDRRDEEIYRWIFVRSPMVTLGSDEEQDGGYKRLELAAERGARGGGSGGLPDTSMVRCLGHVPPVGDPGYAGGTMSLGWPGNDGSVVGWVVEWMSRWTDGGWMKPSFATTVGTLGPTGWGEVGEGQRRSAASPWARYSC